jgi:4-amino-4-deoxy-L-arabinose transferase-like glycosyltransferase
MELRKKLRSNLDFALLAVIVAGFCYVAAQRLGAVPLPDSGDEAMILQVPYEMLHHGRLALPMYRYLGGNIENVWHSFTPVYFVILSAFLKVFGVGLLEGRVFNLITAAAVLVMVYLIGRRCFERRVGLIAVLLLVADATFLDRSRMLRNDFAAAFFALLAYYFYELAEEKKSARFYIAAGLAAGAGVMCHTNVLYMLGAIGLLILLRDGWRALTASKLYLYAASAVAVMAYEIVYDLIDYQNFRAQNSGDKAHFTALSSDGLLNNFVNEQARYRAWYSGGELSVSVPLILLHLFQLLTVISIIYLIMVSLRRLKTGNLLNDPRTRILIVTVSAMLFFALVTGTRRKYVIYMPHLTPWFALCAGILLRDSWSWIRQSRFNQSRTAHQLVTASLVLAVALYGLLLIRQQVKFIAAVRNPNLAAFDELRAALRDIVPQGVCPASVMYPVMWLAFPEADRCYASLERRMANAIDIDGKDYAVIIPSRQNPVWLKEPDENYHLLGEMQNTPYGDLRIYYTGADAGYRELAAKRYQFFGKWRGYVSGEPAAAAREVWSADAAALSRYANVADPVISAEGLAIQPLGKGGRKDRLIELCSVDLQPNTAYQIILDATSTDARAEVLVMDERSGIFLEQLRIVGQAGPQRVEKTFRTLDEARVKLAVRPAARNSTDLLRLSRISIRELGSLSASIEPGSQSSP